MTSTAVRNAASLAVPSTQNTAPVLEYRCLYSHDLRRKSKRWQDGFMRFHTFNKRIMVYDVPRNFIGDTHWREDEAVQDGDELKLEKGVLVQVGEATGSIEQDLTALFEKRRQTHDRSPDKATSPRPTLPATARSTVASLSQLRPKPLNALLGAPKGPHGRAMLATKSPYEHHQRNEHDIWEEGRSSKRQRLDFPPSKNAQPPLWVRTADSQGSYRPQPNTNTRLSFPASKSRKDIIHEVIEVESSDEDPPASSQVVRNKSSRDGDRQAQRKPCADSASAPPFLPLTFDASLSRAKTARPVAGAHSPTYRSTTNKQPVPVHTTCDAVINPLRIVSRKPRKKLMYKDLLPQRPPCRGKAEDGCRQPSDPGSRLFDRMFSDSPVSSIEYTNRPPNAEQRSENARPTKGKQQVKGDSAESSRAFRGTFSDLGDLTSNAPQAARGSSPRRSDEFSWTLVASSTEDSGSHEHALPTSTTSPTKAGPDGRTMIPPLNTIGTKDACNMSHKLSEMDQILLARPRPIDASASSAIGTKSSEGPKASAILRDPPPVFSKTIPEPNPPKPDNNDVPPPKAEELRQKSTPAPQPQRVFQAPQQRVQSRPPPPPPHPRFPLRKSLSASDKLPPLSTDKPPPPKRSLQKATSDLIGLRSILAHAVGPGFVEGKVKEKDLGPWSREAFDLFGWFPEGRGKG
ncbi:hypothetical protein MMC08_001696 [Hypocenomyce scalaris]|nr:hypothetical protein [Hypocenomyce scalaris]